MVDAVLGAICVLRTPMDVSVFEAESVVGLDAQAAYERMVSSPFSFQLN